MSPLEDVHRYATEALVPAQFVSIGTEGCVSSLAYVVFKFELINCLSSFSLTEMTLQDIECSHNDLGSSPCVGG